MLLCTPSAYGQGTAVVGNPEVTLVGRDYRGIPNSSYIVDLGLDVYWADRNVGANSPTDAGTYFAWGEIKQQSYNELFPKVPYTLQTYKFYDTYGYFKNGWIWTIEEYYNK